MNPFGQSKRARLLPYLGMLPGVALYVIFAFGPSIGTVFLSFTDATSVPNTPIHWQGLYNYYQLWVSATQVGNTETIQIIIFRTVIFAIIVTLVQNGIGMFVALLLNQKLRGRVFVRSITFLPVILGVTVIGLIWSLIFSPIGGPAETVWHWFGANSSFLGDNTMAFPIVIFVQIWMYMGYSMLIFLAGLQTIPQELYEAATIDGASRWQSFRHVTFPLLASSVTVNTLLAIIGALQVFDTVYVLTGSSNPSTMTLGLYSFQLAFAGNSLSQGSAIAMVQFVIVLIAALLAQSYLRRREGRLI